ncbi:5-carboxymethyl-2-hydroxymuconate Delta-isomerase [Variovorax sp. PAMC 28711]|uniref:5-carboxymethyl-2-hydroxymuconate Delta-isomerase n=1 Tax=Variovorax sp. PAMC 28711 TaxID=1795631 RepID=UPI00078CAB5D|nr:5-carboxymethyl-2-hydroxymuconate Delta-isomerase [Variovorax sp. PAMC 28711]AMM23762.1 5-carboxymethyl-2-hydroxymuconate isomerase [Variovorax sp. PAMC 28711]
MPHLIVEHSANLGELPLGDLLPALNRSLTGSPEILNETDLKTRFVTIDQFRVGNQAGARGFVHAQLRLLSGRTPEAKHDLSERIAVVLRQFVPRPAGMLVQLSVEVVDMDRGSYVKEKLPLA